MSESDDGEIIALTPAQNVAVEEFCACTGSTPETAKQALEACNWNLEMAVTMQIDYGQPESTSNNSHPSTSVHRNDEDHVRAPIPPVRQVLVDDFADMDIPVHSGPRTRSQIPVFRDTFRDFQSEARYREELAASGGLDVESASDTSKRRTLEELFRPPIDLIFPGSMEAAKDRGMRDNRWLMVNVQDESEFSCQKLNRDVWSNPAVKSIITEHFIFWQVNKSQREGQRYMQFYPVNQFPYIAILDPRTGEKMKNWSIISDSNMFCELITDFLQEHPTPSGEPIPDLPASVAPPSQTQNVADMTEEEQLNAAIAASLQEPIRIDDDEEIETFSYDGDDSPIEIENHNPVVLEANEEVIVEDKDTESHVDGNYTAYLGQSVEPADLVLRFPDGQREKLTVPSDSKLKAVLLLVQSKGFNLNQYDVIANFPRRNIQDMSPEATLSSLGLLKEQLYIQLKQS